MKRKPLKLYVWNDFCPDYTSGLAFAIARSEKQARKLIETAYQHNPYDWGTLTIRPISKPFADAVSGGS